MQRQQSTLTAMVSRGSAVSLSLLGLPSSAAYFSSKARRTLRDPNTCSIYRQKIPFWTTQLLAARLEENNRSALKVLTISRQHAKLLFIVQNTCAA